MSRRSFKTGAKLTKLSKQAQSLKNTHIITFENPLGLQNLKFQSANVELFQISSVEQQVRKIRMIASLKKIGYLANCQWDIPVTLFTIHKNIKDQILIHEQYNKAQDFEVYLNPKIVQYRTEKRPVVQYCHSFPFIEAIVDRSNQIEVSYNILEQNKGVHLVPSIKCTLTGFKAHVFQHCMDHINGLTFLDPEVSKGRLRINELENFFVDSSFLIRQYKVRVKDALDRKAENSQKFLKTKKDYIERISLAFSREMQKASKESEYRLGNSDPRNKPY